MKTNQNVKQRQTIGGWSLTKHQSPERKGDDAMVSYKTEEFMAYHGLRRTAYDSDKPKEIKEVAERILSDKTLFKAYVQSKVDKKESIKRKKVLEDKKKNLTGWKKWFKMILPERVILG